VGGSGGGRNLTPVLGTVVIGGMLAASVLAIFFIPVSFDVVERFGIWIGGKKETPAPKSPVEVSGHGN